MRLRVSYVIMLLVMGGVVFCEKLMNSSEQQNPSKDANMTDPEKFAATIKQLMDSLKNQGYTEEELLIRLEQGVEGKEQNKSYQEECRDRYGEGPLIRCAREFKPIVGHFCGDTEPIEPRGPFCNCLFCSEEVNIRKDVRETDFEENEAMKSESARNRPFTSIYDEKWGLNAKLTSQMNEDKKLKTDSIESIMDDLPRRKFSCQRTDSVYDMERPPVGGDPEFREQFRTVLEEEQQPSLGILKYHEMKSREEGDL